MSRICYTSPSGSGSTPSLQQVTDVGSTSTNEVSILALNITGIVTVATPVFMVTKEWLILCDTTSNSVGVRLENIAVGHIVTVKRKVGTIATGSINVSAIGGTIDGLSSYSLNQPHESAMFQKISATQYVILTPNVSTAGGIYTTAGFTGSVITIPHSILNMPAGVVIIGAVAASNASTAAALQTGYIITTDSTNIYVGLTVSVGVPITILMQWTATRYNNS